MTHMPEKGFGMETSQTFLFAIFLKEICFNIPCQSDRGLLR